MEELFAGVTDPQTEFELTPQQLEFTAAQKHTYESLVSAVPISRGMEISQAEKPKNDASFTYGEVVRLALELCRQRCSLTAGGVFVDLGSVKATQGTGKAVVAAALLHPFDRCRGIEVLPGLHTVATELQSLYIARTGDCNRVEFVQGSVFEEDWSDATLVLANCGCFRKQQRLDLGSRARVGTLAIAVIHQVPGWRELARLERNMSWGQATIYVQRKESDVSPIAS